MVGWDELPGSKTKLPTTGEGADRRRVPMVGEGLVDDEIKLRDWASWWVGIRDWQSYRH